MADTPVHALPTEDVARVLGIDPDRGLDEDEVLARRLEHGTNELPREKRPSVLWLFLKQFHSGLTYILFVAAGLSYFAGERNDAIGIILAVLIDAVVGFVQERRAEGALEKLRDMVVQEASVLRGGVLRRVPSKDVVPGDVLLLSEGDRVVADARLVECKEMRVDESALTGESVPSRKSADAAPADALVADRHDMTWMGTTVVTGSGKGVVIETGGRTAFGAIAMSLVAIRRERTPLETRLDKLGRQLGILTIALCGIVMLVGDARGFPPLEMFFFAIALMVSVIPEGMPAVLAVVLAIGVQRMAKRNAIVRHVPSVETLGTADVICTDKTGTLTENKMTVRDVVLGSRHLRVTGEGWESKGEFFENDRAFRPADAPEADLLLRAAALCNKSFIEWRDGRAAVVGDPTEGALIVLAAKAGYAKADLAKEYALVDDVPFSSERKYRAMLFERVGHDGRRSRVAFAVGAYGVLRDRAARRMVDGEERPFDAQARQAFDESNVALADRALRVLGVAFRPMPDGQETLSDADVRDLTFLGLVGMIDPPRAGVAKAIGRCRSAGVRVVMITGDQRATAVAVAREIGLVGGSAPAAVYTEKDVAAMDAAAFAAALKDAAIFARVTPETKLRIVGGLQADGHVVAMTGDGVNDAPALKKASIGVAMGIAGTDVTKEVADMVLADDNFVSIVNAIEEGRIVFRNVRQTTAYLFMTNVGEAVTILVSLLMGLPLPLLPAQILWMNLVTDGFPDVALATEPATADVLSEPPRKRNAPVITGNTLALTLITASLMCAGTLWLFVREYATGDLVHARTVAFTAMALFQLWNVFNMRSPHASLFSLKFASNPFVLWAVAISLVLQLSVQYVPALQRIFSTKPLGINEWVPVILVTSSVFFAVELYKVLIRRGIVPKSWA